MSMTVIPNVGQGSMGKELGNSISTSKSTNDMGHMFRAQLLQLQKNLEKKVQKKTRGISQYLDEGSDDDPDFSSDEAQEGDKCLTGQSDPSKLIDLELVNLLKFCNELNKSHKDTDEHQEALLAQSLELGKKTKEKTLILDMDETMIAAKFDGQEPKNFKINFSFDFQRQKIHVRFRPYLQDALEKLSQLYEIVAFTAGVQEYADPILD